MGLNHFITSLAAMVIVRGLCLVITKGTPLSLFTLPPDFKAVGQGTFYGVPYVILIFVAVVVLFDFLLRRATAFRKVFYTGSNEKAALYSGIKTNQVKFWVTVLCATLSGVAGVIYMSRFGAATPTFGVGMELNIIAAAVIGGASLKGGSGTILGAILGMALLSVVTSSLILLDVSVYWQDMIKGLHSARRRLHRPFPAQAEGCLTCADRPDCQTQIVTPPREEIVIARQMHQALVLHFLEGLTQAQIADQLGISHATVNRLIKRGRQLGLVEIKIKSPVEPLVDMEEQLAGARRHQPCRRRPDRLRQSADGASGGRRGGGPAAAGGHRGRRHDLHHRRQGRQRRRCRPAGAARASMSRSSRRPAASRASTIPTSTTSRR